MNPSAPQHATTAMRWAHRLAWALACCTFPLIWVGGLVTTYGAGMAVPDWPTTFHYWFWYPIRKWFAVWDVVLEHGHRVLGMTAGLLTIALAVALWRSGHRRLRWLGIVALVGVVFQGTLGGLRVIANQVLLANVHGCTAPLFFSLAAALVTLSSPAWRGTAPARPGEGAAWLRTFTLALPVAIWLQIVAGAQLRHLLPDMAAAWTTLWVWVHVLNAFGLLAAVWWLRAIVGAASGGQPALVGRVGYLAWLLTAQFVLGLGTWLTNYGVPAWFADTIWSVRYTVVSQGRLQTWTTTAHVAIGSLALIGSVSLTLWTRRLVGGKRN